MSKKRDDAEVLRKSREFIDYAKRHGCEVESGKSSHIKVRNAKGFAVIPYHPGDLARGTRKAIIKTFIAMGIAILLFMLITTLTM